MAAKKSSKKSTPTQASSGAQAPVQSYLAAIRAKFTRLNQLRSQLNGVKALYTEHDQLVEELLPLFIEIRDNEFLVHREITLGNKKYRFNPFFYDETKGKLRANQWKSVAFKSGTVE